jgi:hypothetical protein
VCDLKRVAHLSILSGDEKEAGIVGLALISPGQSSFELALNIENGVD